MSAGHIRRRGDSWELRYRVSGKTHTETVRGLRRDAQRVLRERLELADRGLAPAKGSCGEWFDRWLAAVRAELSPVTLQVYRKQVENHLRPAFGETKLRELTTDEIRAAWADLTETLAPSSVRLAHRVLSAALSYAVETKQLPSSPAAGWRKGRGLPKLLDVEKLALSPDQANQLIEAARDTTLFAPIVLGLGLGARRGEIAALRWSCVAADGDVTIGAALRQLSASDIQVGPPKNGKARRVRLPPSYAELLREWKLRQAQEMLALGHRVGPDDLICTNIIGQPLSPNQITNQFAALSRRLKLGVSFHGLRHTHASILLAAGESLKTVQHRLGHSKPTVTLNVYAHAIPRDGDAEAARIDAALRGSNFGSKSG